MPFSRYAILCVAVSLVPFNAWATQPKIAPETCDALRLEQIKFRQSGIVDDMNKGAAWAKANLTADRLREIQHYIELDEQVEFGCRDAKLSAEAKRASEAAARIEINSDADPTAPVAKDPPKPGVTGKADAADKPVKKKGVKKKSAKSSNGKESKADVASPPPVIVQSQSEAAPSGGGAETSTFTGGSALQNPSLPAFGAGAAEVLPWSSP